MTISTKQCLAQPQRSHYDGGMIVNPEFNQGRQEAVKIGASGKDKKSFYQAVQLEKGKIYSLSGKSFPFGQ